MYFEDNKFASDGKNTNFTLETNSNIELPTELPFGKLEHIHLRIIIIIIKSDTDSSYIFGETSKLSFTKQREKFLCICTRVHWLGEEISSHVYCRDGCYFGHVCYFHQKQ